MKIALKKIILTTLSLCLVLNNLVAQDNTFETMSYNTIVPGSSFSSPENSSNDEPKGPLKAKPYEDAQGFGLEENPPVEGLQKWIALGLFLATYSIVIYKKQNKIKNNRE